MVGRQRSAEPCGDIFAVGQYVREVDPDATAGYFRALAEGGDHASPDPSWSDVMMALLQCPLGEDDLRERGLDDLDDLGTPALVCAHSRLVADTELLPFPGADLVLTR